MAEFKEYAEHPTKVVCPKLCQNLEKGNFDVPPSLCTKGDAELLNEDDIVFVNGARRCTPYGQAVSELIGRTAAELGLTVLTTASIGCSAAAARAAQNAGGKTVVVTGAGIDQSPYPARSADIYSHADLIVSAEKIGRAVYRYGFVRRNAYVAALADLHFVAEAGPQGGVMMTAEYFTLMKGAHIRGQQACPNLYAIPGSIFSPQSLGANELIQSGRAQPLANASAIATVLRNWAEAHSQRYRPSVDMPAYAPPQPQHDVLLQALAADAMRVDDLCMILDMPNVDVLRELASREAEGTVTRMPDGRWSLTSQRLLQVGKGSNPTSADFVRRAGGAVGAQGRDASNRSMGRRH